MRTKTVSFGLNMHVLAKIVNFGQNYYLADRSSFGQKMPDLAKSGSIGQNNVYQPNNWYQQLGPIFKDFATSHERVNLLLCATSQNL